MASIITTEHESPNNPIDSLEELAARNDWQFERQGDGEIALAFSGGWCEYQMWFVWQPELGALHFSCAFDMRVIKDQRPAMYPLLAMLNERLALGHFELWSEEGCPAFRHTLLVREDSPFSNRLVEDLVERALGECERFYPAFQFVVWGGKTAEEAIEASLLDTLGEA